MKEETPSTSDLSKMLVKVGCLKFGVFKLTSGKLSPYYIDLRLIPSFPGGMKKVISIYASIANDEIGAGNFERIAGIPTAGMPFASVLAYKLSKPFLYVREAAKTHGRERRIEGVLSPGDRVLLVDDLITSGKSIVEAANILRGEGGMVSDALVLIDREEGGFENLSKVGVKLHSFMRISGIARELHEAELIDKRRYEEILKQTGAKGLVRKASS